MTGEGEQASGTREGGPPESAMVVTGGGAGEPPGPEQPRVQVTPRAVLVVMLNTLALLGGLYLLWELRNIVVWCVVAMFLAVALNPAVDWLDRRGLPRVVAIVLVYLALLFLVVGTTALLLPPLISRGQALVTFVIDLVRDPPGGTPQAALQDLADSYGLGGYLNDYLDTLRDQIGSLPERLSAAVAPLVSVTRSIIGGVVSLISVLLLTFFLLLDGRRFVETGLLLVKPSRQPRIRRLLDRSAQAVSGYITGNLAISLIVGVATYIALVLLGVPYALTLASST
jgi:predicted PurR-regulated permease PerM